MATLKSAIHIFANEQNPKRWQLIEEEELQVLDRILTNQSKQDAVNSNEKNQLEVEETKEVPTFKP